MKMTPMNVRMTAADLKTIAMLADKLDYKQADVTRLALSIGLLSLQAIKKSQAELYQEEAARMQERRIEPESEPLVAVARPKGTHNQKSG